jgi:hypothetical protein
MLTERLDANVPEQFWRLSAPLPVIATALMGGDWPRVPAGE